MVIRLIFPSYSGPGVPAPLSKPQGQQTKRSQFTESSVDRSIILKDRGASLQRLRSPPHHFFMAEAPPIQVCAVELYRNGILITFADGKCALFPSDLLYASLPQAEELCKTDEEESSD
jgi:hypothetical protein